MAKVKKAAITITIERPNGANAPAHLLANAELHFHTGLMAGLRLTGFSLWKATTREGRRFVSVTLPNRPAERKGTTQTAYYDHVRGEGEAIKQLKRAIVQAYRDFARAEDVEVPEDHQDVA